MSTSMDSAVLWNLGRRLGAVLGAASGERFRPKPRALAGLEPALDALGVKVSLEDLARANREDRATAIDAIRKGAGRLASLGWSAQWLRDYASLEANERPPLSEKAREVASRFILESAERQVRLSYLLSRIAEMEKINVEETDVDAQIRKIVDGARPEQRTDVENWMKGRRDTLRAQLREERLFDFLIQQAKVTEVPAA